jgi:predicted RNA-binding Zn ribbon-like protein
MNTGDEPGAKAPAPGDLRIVQLFVNSLDIEEGTEQFDSPGALSSWLYRHGLTARRVKMGDRDLRRARSFRELLRDMALANNGEPMAPAMVGELQRELSRLRFRIEFDPIRELRFESSRGGLDEALGHLMAIVSAEMIRGRWGRMKACARDACRWVFYDHSRNRTGTWCSMSICGSRTKVSAYYRRHRRTSPSGRPTAEKALER